MSSYNIFKWICERTPRKCKSVSVRCELSFRNTNVQNWNQTQSRYVLNSVLKASDSGGILYSRVDNRNGDNKGWTRNYHYLGAPYICAAISKEFKLGATKIWGFPRTYRFVDYCLGVLTVFDQNLCTPNFVILHYVLGKPQIFVAPSLNSFEIAAHMYGAPR